MFRRAAINLCDIVASAVSGVDRRGGGTIGRLVAFGTMARLIPPSSLALTHTGLDTDDLAESLGMLPALVQAGLLTPDDELERAIRERLGAGDLPDEAQRSTGQRQTQEPVGVASLAEALVRRRRHEKA